MNKKQIISLGNKLNLEKVEWRSFNIFMNKTKL
jgi:hypothetical protein